MFLRVYAMYNKARGILILGVVVFLVMVGFGVVSIFQMATLPS